MDKNQAASGGRTLDPVEMWDRLQVARAEVTRLCTAIEKAVADLRRDDVDRRLVADSLTRVLGGEAVQSAPRAMAPICGNCDAVNDYCAACGAKLEG